MIRHAFPARSPVPDGSNFLVEPPRASYIFVLPHLIDPRPRPDPGGDVVGIRSGLITASSGDGLLILTFLDGRVTAPVDATRSGAPERKVTEFHMDPDITRFVCNPVSGELFRLPDVDGTKKTLLFCHDMGLLTRSDAGHGPPDRYAAAALSNDREDAEGEGNAFVMRRFLSQTGEWEKLVDLPLPLPRARRMNIYSEVVAFAGRLWWADLNWGVISADPFSDRPELRFIELPRGSVRTVPSNDWPQAQGLHRRMGVSEGRLHYVEVSQKEPFLLSSFALDDDGSCWTLKHWVALDRLMANEGGHPALKVTPRIAVIDPLNASVVYVIIGKDVLGVDMDLGKVLSSSLVDESEGPPWTITSVLKPCVLPQWLGLSRIPTAGHEVVAFAGRLWWVDVSCGAVSADPFSDRPDLHFVELPRGSVTHSELKLRVLGSSWTLEHRMALSTLLVDAVHSWQGSRLRIGVVDPLNSSVMHITIGTNALAVDMVEEKVLGCSMLDVSDVPKPKVAVCSFLKPSVLPPWLGSSQIPSAGDHLSHVNFEMHA
ncbi:hypothetical protein EJB05_35938, partial [Eragrostis curvula]